MSNYLTMNPCTLTISSNQESHLLRRISQWIRRMIRRQVVSSSPVEMASSSVVDGDALLSSEQYVRYEGSLLSLQPWIFRKASCNDDWERMERNGDVFSGFRGEFGISRRSPASRRVRRYYVEPLNSVENCFVPYNGHLRIDEYVCTSDEHFRSSYCSSGMQPEGGPHDIADGVSSSIQSEALIHKEASVISSGAVGTLVGIPSLPEPRKPKIRSNIMDTHTSCRFIHYEGSLDSMLLFCIGIGIGVMFTVLSNRIEVEKLSKLLKQKEDLVRDLQEDLETKDSLTVNELLYETCGHEEVNHSCSNTEEYIELFLDQNPSMHFTTLERKEYNSQHFYRPGEDAQSLSNIEAELESELERLEQNISASDLQLRMSELDPDLVGDVVPGELGTDMLDQGTRGGLPDGNSSTGGTSTTRTYTANYAVSPRELSLRLHEVIQIRLEERIKELETALLQNQKQLHLMEAEQARSQITFSDSDIESSLNQESPTIMPINGGLSPALCLNLSVDALDAHEESYKEITKKAETKNPPSLNTSKYIDDMQEQSDQSPVRELESGEGNILVADDNIFEREATWESILLGKEYNGMIEGGQEYSEGDSSDDEEGIKLIQQILEKTNPTDFGEN